MIRRLNLREHALRRWLRRERLAADDRAAIAAVSTGLLLALACWARALSVHLT